MNRSWKWFWTLALLLPLAASMAWAVWDNAKLFFITLLLNIIALRIVRKYREQYD